MRHNLPFILLAATAFFGCKKVEKKPLCEDVIHKNYTYDTIQPSDYLMTYPGSWWAFSDGKIDSCFSLENVSIAEATPNGTCKTILEDMHVLPLFSYGRGYAYASFESDVRSFSDLSTTEYIPLISETPGEVYKKKNISQDPSVTTTVTSFGILDSIIVGSTIYYDVLHMKRRVDLIHAHLGVGPSYSYDYFYCKNIGAVRKIRWEYGNTDTFDLVDYYIAPH